MRAKLSVLRACRRVLKSGGRLAFATIYIPPGLSEDAYRRAVLAGAPEVASRQEHQAMLRSAGFVEITETDLTDEYLRVARGLVEARQRYAPDLRKSKGDSVFDQMQMDKRAAVAAIEAGLLGRSLFMAKRPPPHP